MDVSLKTKFIVVTGGVISGIGKGVATAAIASLLERNYKTIPIKCDGYLNSDPGTINPIEHGEVYVLDDGSEVDMDFGHYERFLGIRAKRDWNITMGKVYKQILDEEREGRYLGKTVQLIPHVTDNIKNRIYTISKEEEAEIVLIEIGGTVGDLENALFIEAVRQMRLEAGRKNMLFIHLTYIPKPSGVNELKSKPTQQSIKTINEMGIYPDLIIARCHEDLTPSVIDKISLYCNIEKEHIITSPDLENIYSLPKVFHEQKITQIINERLSIGAKPYMKFYDSLASSFDLSQTRPPVNIAICGKYTDLEDSYASINETLKIITLHHGVSIKTRLIDTTESNEEVERQLEEVDGIIVPGGFGSRGIEGKINAIRYARENKIPFLGICYGMQLAVIEFARHVCGIKDANTREVEHEIKNRFTPVIDLLEDQKNVQQLGASMRLGGHDVELKKGSLAYKIYGQSPIRERFRHRYEVNPHYVDILEKSGMVFSGYSKTDGIMQIMELPNHPFFMTCQFHPEVSSILSKPEKLFEAFVLKSHRQGV